VNRELRVVKPESAFHYSPFTIPNSVNFVASSPHVVPEDIPFGVQVKMQSTDPNPEIESHEAG
jgi:hypothetical protein